jgi:hypothetical protein
VTHIRFYICRETHLKYLNKFSKWCNFMRKKLVKHDTLYYTTKFWLNMIKAYTISFLICIEFQMSIALQASYWISLMFNNSIKFTYSKQQKLPLASRIFQVVTNTIWLILEFYVQNERYETSFMDPLMSPLLSKLPRIFQSANI